MVKLITHTQKKTGTKTTKFQLLSKNSGLIPLVSNPGIGT
jgi:hypothetical protein